MLAVLLGEDALRLVLKRFGGGTDCYFELSIRSWVRSQGCTYFRVSRM